MLYVRERCSQASVISDFTVNWDSGDITGHQAKKRQLMAEYDINDYSSRYRRFRLSPCRISEHSLTEKADF